MFAAAIVVIIVLVLTVGIALYLRTWVLDESRTEARLHDPHTHSVAYAVPVGVDPAVYKVALAHAGFASVLERVGDDECLRVECEPSQRAEVRRIIEDVHATRYDGADLQLHDVVFVDER